MIVIYMTYKVKRILKKAMTLTHKKQMQKRVVIKKGKIK